jgi:hypothetical protein
LIEDLIVEIVGLIIGGVSAATGALGVGIKGIALLRSLDNQIAALRLSQVEEGSNCRSELAEIRTQLALIQSQLELARSIAAHPRHRPMGEPIE